MSPAPPTSKIATAPEESSSELRVFRIDRIPWFDCFVCSAVLVLILALRALCIHALRWHSDEPQHLHVVWGWATGRLLYREVFDNHSPLFAWLFSPLFRLVGERDDIVDVMRWFMLPLLLVSLWCIYTLWKTAFSRRIGVWAVIFSGLFPVWFFMMAQFRTDVLWTTLWLVVLVILVTGRLSPRRTFFAGLMLGATFAVSMKSTIMLLTILVSGVLTLAFIGWSRRRERGPWPLKEISLLLGAGLAGLIMIPSAFILYFAAKGALPDMYYCVIQHNLVGVHGVERILRRARAWQSLFIPLTLIAAIAAGRLDSHRPSISPPGVSFSFA